MTGQLISVATGGAGGFGQQIIQDAVDLAAGMMPGLVGYFDPEDLGASGETVYGRGDTYGENTLIGYTANTNFSVGTVAGAYNGRRVLKSSGNGGGYVDIGPGVLIKKNFTIVSVQDIDAAAYAAATDYYLYSAYNPEKPPSGGFDQFARFIGSTSQWSFNVSGESSSSAVFAEASIAADTPVVLAWSFDENGQQRIYKNSTSTVVGTDADSLPATVQSVATKLRLGARVGAVDTNWLGAIGKVLIFDKSYHKTTGELAALNSLMAACKSHYAIA